MKDWRNWIIAISIAIVIILTLFLMPKAKKPTPLINNTLETHNKVRGYAEDGRIDMATVEGYRIFRKECKDIGIILPRRPQYE